MADEHLAPGNAPDSRTVKAIGQTAKSSPDLAQILAPVATAKFRESVRHVEGRKSFVPP